MTDHTASDTYANLTVLTPEEVLQKYSTAAAGLSDAGVKRQTAQFGKNILTEHETTVWHILIRQLRSPFIYMLLAASAVSLFLAETTDAVLILLFIVINTLLGFYQEYRSERTVKLLKRFLRRMVRVRRNGVQTDIDTGQLVPGDIVLLDPGSIIPADVRFIDAGELTVDESVLTGESVPVKKFARAAKNEARTYFEADNIGFSGTTVVAGRGEGVVVATGTGTVFAGIAKLTTESQKESVFEKEIYRFSTFILKLVAVTLGAVVVANFFIKGPQATGAEFFVFAVALAVSVVPEALPVVATFSFSRGALRLAQHKVVVKRLSAVEDLGSIDVLCTDKTGTLTENKLRLGEVAAADEKLAVRHAYLAKSEFRNDRSVNPFDEALAAALSAGDAKTLDGSTVLAREPFDPQKRRSISLVDTAQGRMLIIRGAPEAVLAACSKITAEKKKELAAFVRQRGLEGKRVIAIASKKVETSVTSIGDRARDMDLSGILSFVDPIKTTAKDAVTRAGRLGVSIKVITGDAPEVAGWVGHEIGLISDASAVITGDAFDRLSISRQHQAVSDYHVFSRVTPVQKFRIIELLKEQHDVGFLGEGINDAPALKIANVALAVDHATDIAREASDIVLLKKDLKVIIDGIREGREIFANTTKYITATLAANFGNFYAVATASLFINYLPMLPVQILLVNLLSDFPMIAIATDSVDKHDLAHPRKYNLREILQLATFLGIVSSFFDFITFGIFSSISPGVLQTSWFAESILSELIFIYSVRVKPFFLRAVPPSFPLVGLTFVAAVITVWLPFTALGRDVFQFQTPTAGRLLVVFGIILAYFVATETVKVFYFRTIGAQPGAHKTRRHQTAEHS